MINFINAIIFCFSYSSDEREKENIFFKTIFKNLMIKRQIDITTVGKKILNSNL